VYVWLIGHVLSVSSVVGIWQQDAPYVQCFQSPCKQPEQSHRLPVERFLKSKNTIQQTRAKFDSLYCEVMAWLFALARVDVQPTSSAGIRLQIRPVPVVHLYKLCYTL